MGCQCSCSDNKPVRIVYACAGACNVGQISNAAAIALHQDGFASMSCAAAVGAELSGFIESAKAATDNILIDGCPVGCVRKTFDRLGIANYRTFIVTDSGVIKAKILEPDPEIVRHLVEAITSQER
jgi:uncharacterized metal-binding protein